MKTQFSIDLWLLLPDRDQDPDHANNSDRYEEAASEAELRALLEVYRREGKYAFAQLWKTADDRPNAWDRIGTYILKE